MKDQMKQVFFRCDCSYLGHVIEVSYEIDEDYPEHSYFLVQTQLDCNLGFFQRVWVALKYVFTPNNPCGFGGWSSTMLKNAEMNQIRKLMDEYENGLKEE